MAVSCGSAVAQGRGQIPSDLPSDREGTCLILCAEAGNLAQAIAQKTRYTVYCLDSDRKRAEASRKRLDAAGLYGTRVTVDIGPFAPLPYADYCGDVVLADLNLVSNLPELLRISKPNGLLYLKGAQGKNIKQGLEVLDDKGPWLKARRLRPAGMDEWSHIHHNAANDARSYDELFDYPFRTQWINSHPPLLSCGTLANRNVFTVTAGGKYFEQRAATRGNCVAAMDAYDGRLLWTYHSHTPDAERHFGSQRSYGRGREYITTRDNALLVSKGNEIILKNLGIKKEDMLRVKTGKSKEDKAQEKRWNAMINHANNMNPFVATADRVYVSHVQKKGCAVLDAATGKELATFVLPDEIEPKGITFPWQYMSCDGERLYGAKGTVLAALDAKTGKALWHYNGPLAKHTITVGDVNVMLFDYEKGATALDKRTGEQRWQFPETAADVPLSYQAKFPNKKGMMRNVCGVFYRNGIWTVSGGSGISGFDEKSGKILWTYKHPATPDGRKSILNSGRYWYNFICSAGEGAQFYSDKGIRAIVDPVANKIIRGRLGMQNQCARITASRHHLFNRGIFVKDMRTGQRYTPVSLRTACTAGVIVGNGLAYLSPPGCECPTMTPNLAMASAGKFVPGEADANIETRLVKGPAYTENPKSEIRNPKSGDWPVYRHDSARTGTVSTEITGTPTQIWRVKVPGTLTSPAIAQGLVFVGSTADRIVALDAKTGKERWRFLTGGPVTFTPTWWAGRLYVGCQDGWVHCLDATTGQLAWAFQAAPQERKIMINETLRSAWSANGGVLVKDGKAWFYSGLIRIDGAYLYCLDAQDGKIIWAKKEDFHPHGTMAASDEHLVVPQGVGIPRVFLLKDGTVPVDPHAKKGGWGGGKTRGNDLLIWKDLILAGGKRFDYSGYSKKSGLPGRRGYIPSSLPGAPSFGGAGGKLHWASCGPSALGGGRGADSAFLWSTPAVCDGFIFQGGPKGIRAVTEQVVRANEKKEPLTDKAKWTAKWEGIEQDFDVSIPLIKAGSQIVTARPEPEDKSTLLGYAAADGSQKWELSLEDTIIENGLAAASGRLFASTRSGSVVCFGNK